MHPRSPSQEVLQAAVIHARARAASDPPLQPRSNLTRLSRGCPSHPGGRQPRRDIPNLPGGKGAALSLRASFKGQKLVSGRGTRPTQRLWSLRRLRPFTPEGKREVILCAAKVTLKKKQHKTNKHHRAKRENTE